MNMDSMTRFDQGSDWYRGFFTLHPLAAWIIDLQTARVLDANEAAVSRYGYSRDEFVNMSIGDFVEWKGSEGGGARHAPGDALSAVPVRLRDHSGFWVDMEATTFPLPSSSGPARVLQVAPGPAAVESGTGCIAERYRLAAEASRDALYDWMPGSDTVWWSEQFVRDFGYRPSEARGGFASWQRRIHPDDRVRVTESLQAAVAGQRQGWQAEYRLRRGDGSYAHVYDRCRLLYDEAGAIARGVGLVAEVTSRKEAEAAAHEYQYRLALIARHTHEVVWLREAGATGYAHVAGACQQVLGLSCEEVMDDPARLFARVHPDDLPALKEALRTVDGGEAVSLEFRVVDPALGFRWVQARMSSVPGGGGVPRMVIGIAEDVTARRRVETELLESRELFRASVENFLDPLSICEAVRDAAGRIVDFRVAYVNAAAEASNGMPRDEQLDRLLGEILPALREQGVIDRYVQVVETGEPVMLQRLRFRVPADGPHRVEYAFDIRAGKLGDGVVITWRDVTAQVRAQEELEQSEERFRQLAENIREIFWISDPGFTRVHYVSPSFEVVWGHPREPLYDHPRQVLELIHPDDRERVEAAFEGLQEGRFDEEYRIIRPDSEVRWTRVRGFPVYDQQGVIEKIAGIAEDITEQKETEFRFETSLAEKEVLLREIHHRVKNNLQIVSSLMRLQSRLVDLPQVREVFRQNQSRLQSMALLHELLYRSDRLAQIDLRDYLDQLGRHLLHLFGAESRIRMSTTGSQAVGLDIAVPCGLIANELITNSIRHAFPGRPGTIRVDVAPWPGRDSFVITIRDDGVGMSPAVGASPRPTLGLQLVSMLAGQLGGTVQQQVEAGTATSVEIPYIG